jgi:hypothetical protein
VCVSVCVCMCVCVWEWEWEWEWEWLGKIGGSLCGVRMGPMSDVPMSDVPMSGVLYEQNVPYVLSPMICPLWAICPYEPCPYEVPHMSKMSQWVLSLRAVSLCLNKHKTYVLRPSYVHMRKLGQSLCALSKGPLPQWAVLKRCVPLIPVLIGSTDLSFKGWKVNVLNQGHVCSYTCAPD